MDKTFPLFGIVIALLIALLYRYLSEKEGFRKLNIRFIAAHFLACVFLMLGLRQFAFLTEVDVMRMVNEQGIASVLKNVSSHEIMTLSQWLFVAAFIAYHFSIIISIIVMLKKKVSLLNSLVVYTLTFFILCIQFYKFDVILATRDSIGYNVLTGDLLPFKYILPGVVFTLLSLGLFFNPWTNKAPAKQPTYNPWLLESY